MQHAQSGVITLKDAHDCTSAPQFSHPCSRNSTPVNVHDLTGAEALQAVGVELGADTWHLG